MSQFKDEYIVCDGRKYTLTHDLHFDYFDDYEGLVDICIPSGYQTDFSSIPLVVSMLCPIKEYTKPYIVYDYLCTHPEYKRESGFDFYKEEADLLLYRSLYSDGANIFKRCYAYYLIRFHFREWNKYRH